MGEAGEDEFIRRLATLCPLDRGDVEALAKCRKARRTYSRQTSIDPHRPIAIQSGLVAGYHAFRDRKRQIVRLYFPGDLLLAGPAFLDLQALCSVELIELDPALWEAANRHGAVERARNQATLVSEAKFHRWVAVLSGRSADVRLAHLLLDTFARLRALQNVSDHSFCLPITQQDIAEIVGLSLVHTNKSLRALAAENFVRIKNHQVEIIDLEKLAQLAEINLDEVTAAIPSTYGSCQPPTSAVPPEMPACPSS